MPQAAASAVRAEAIQALRRQLKSSRDARTQQRCVPTGIAALDGQLPDGGLPTAAVMEWISDEAGLLAASLALRAVMPIMAQPGCLAIIDERHEFNADAAQSLGIPLPRILLVRPRMSVRHQTPSRRSSEHSETLWALEQSARCPGVRVVLCWLERSSTAVMRRLQLAVERSGVTVVLIRPVSALQQPSFADLRLHVQKAVCSSPNISVRSFGVSISVSARR